jgi:serine/threonine protein kinase
MTDSLRVFFDAALAHTGDARVRFLRDSCPEGLQPELARLLAAHDRAGSFLDVDVPAFAGITDGTADWAGRRLGPYQVAREIGRGGMGVVFLAVRVDDLFDKQVAIKVLRSSLEGPDMLDRFRRERQILANLDHPNIARLIDGGTTEEGLPYVVMDYVDGRPIDVFCDANQLSLAQRLQLFQVLCGAVHYAHQNLVVHRDLKPSNIVVARDGQLKLVDFGIATLLQPEGPGRTRTGLRPMTLEYASPEQVTGDPITTASDVYALGVVLYELVSGQPPYPLDTHSDHEVMRLVCDHEPEAPSKVVGRVAHSEGAKRQRQLSGDVDTIVLKTLRKEPARRYSSAAELCDDIARHLNGLPVLAQSDTVRYRTVKFVRRHAVAVAAAALIFVAFLGGVAAIAREARVAERQRQNAEVQRVRAERRFNDVRRLANSVLFEIHDAIAHLPGSTSARKLVVSKALDYLGSLESEAGSDVSLQQELAAAYDRVGDVLGNPAMANLGDTAGALSAYRKALTIREALASSDSALVRSPVVSYEKVGGAQFAAGDLAEAFLYYRKAMTLREEWLRVEPGNAEVAQHVAEMAGRLCNGLILLGDVPGALANCHRSDSITRTLLAAHPTDTVLLTQMAVGTISRGNALRLNGQPADAAITLHTAIERFEPLIAADPTNADLRRRSAIAYAYLANARLDLHDSTAAMDNYQSAIHLLQDLVEADPSNVRYRTDLTYMLFRHAGLLMKAGRTGAARMSTMRGLAFLRISAERPAASAENLNDYAWWLATCEPADLREPVHAIGLAKRAIALAHSPNAAYLHTLGWSYFRAGDRSSGIGALEGALAILQPPPPGGASTGLRRQVEVDLSLFRARAHPSNGCGRREP